MIDFIVAERQFDLGLGKRVCRVIVSGGHYGKSITIELPSTEKDVASQLRNLADSLDGDA